MEGFIEYINDLAEDLFDYPGKKLFSYGGCYELYKVIKTLVPEIELYMDGKEHVVFKYKDDFYDTTGKRENSNFEKVTAEDELLIANSFGGHLAYLNITENILNELRKTNLSFIKEYYDIDYDDSFLSERTK